MMSAALDEARRARDAGEVPIGAVVAVGGEIVGRGFNQPIGAGDPDRPRRDRRDSRRGAPHRELSADRRDAVRDGRTLPDVRRRHRPRADCDAGVRRGRTEVGGGRSTVRGGELPGHNHRFEIVSGVREAECRELMQEFFRAAAVDTHSVLVCAWPVATQSD